MAQEMAPQQALKVIYSTTFGENSVLKEVPKEVRLIRREATQKNIGQQVALNALLFVVGGGFGAQGFNKTDLNGIAIPDVEDRTYLKNPVSEEYVASLKASLNETAASNPAYKDKIFKQPVVVQGGAASLVYESLMGGPVTYFFKLDLLIAKRKETAGMFTLNPVVYIDCSGRSEQSKTLENWALDNYKEVSIEFQKLLNSCQNKTIAEMGNLLDQ